MNTYFILAAGRGTRLWPVGEGLPKCMVRVLGKPLLEWAIEGILQDAKKIVVVVGYNKDLVIGYFSKKPYADKLTFVEQKEQKGTAHAFLQAEKEVEGNFVTMTGDSFADPSLYSLMAETIRKQPKEFHCFTQKVDDVRGYGAISVDKKKFRGVVEKPKDAASGFINLWNFYLPKEFFSLLHKVKLSPRGELEATDALNELVKKHDINVVEYKGFRSEITYFWNHLDINLYALNNLMQDERLGEVGKFVYIEGKVHVGKGTQVRPGTYIQGPAYIGEDCLIGPNAFIRPGAIIEDRCHVGTSEIKNSVMMNDANAAHFSFIGDSVVCEDVNLGGGTMLANLRFDEKNVVVHYKQGPVDSKKRKLGCAIGRGTKVGANVVINPGILIGHNCRIYPSVNVSKNMDNDTTNDGASNAKEDSDKGASK